MNYSKQALRAVCLAYKDLEEGECGKNHDEPEDEALKDIEKNGLTFIAILGIQDPVNPEAASAIEQFKKAGINVRMVTGDNIITAK